MDSIQITLDELRNGNIINLEQDVKQQEQEIGVISKRIEVAENWMDNVLSVKQPDTYRSKAELEKFKKIKNKVREWKIEISLLKEDVNKQFREVKDQIFPKAETKELWELESKLIEKWDGIAEYLYKKFADRTDTKQNFKILER